MKARHLLAACLLLSACDQRTAPAPSAAPAATNTAAADPAPPVDAAALYAQGDAAHGLAACAACHGPAGEGNAAAGFPALAAQVEGYLGHQLDAYANGAREQPIMNGIAKALSPAQRQALALYLSQLPRPASAARDAAADLARGQQLVENGDDALGVQACANCHGPEGGGAAPVFPALAGQHPGYLLTSLQAWKSGARNTDPSQHMTRIAQALSDTDLQAVSAWYGGLSPAASP
jgi:cytochrome c553